MIAEKHLEVRANPDLLLYGHKCVVTAAGKLSLSPVSPVPILARTVAELTAVDATNIGAYFLGDRVGRGSQWVDILPILHFSPEVSFATPRYHFQPAQGAGIFRLVVRRSFTVPAGASVILQ
jgi:hypothetical protein